jgi:hypothetical protein
MSEAAISQGNIDAHRVVESVAVLKGWSRHPGQAGDSTGDSFRGDGAPTAP